MSEIITFSSAELTPGRDAVLQNQGIPAGAVVSDEIETLLDSACHLLAEVAAPAGILRELSKPEFELVYQGEGRNEPRTPVGDIFRRAGSLALFVVTLGEPVSRKIDECFKSNGFALGAMLDAAASAAADKLATVAAGRFAEHLVQSGRPASESAVLPYSPGYCGWHISGQKRLFEYLRPERIGVTLTASFLMQPLKSVSGVLIAGPKELHEFDMCYSQCNRCETRSCQERIRALRAG